MQTTLPDGTILSFSLADGIGSEYHTNDKATEDFMTVNGKHYKLDVTDLQYDKDNYMNKKVLKTKEGDTFNKKVFPERKCEVEFVPIGKHEEGNNFVVIAFKQFLTYGYFSGFCQTEDHGVIRIEKAFGLVEHVFNRW